MSHLTPAQSIPASAGTLEVQHVLYRPLVNGGQRHSKTLKSLGLVILTPVDLDGNKGTPMQVNLDELRELLKTPKPISADAQMAQP